MELLSTIAYRLNGKNCVRLGKALYLLPGRWYSGYEMACSLLVRHRTVGIWQKPPDASQNIYMVPAFTGLGAPYWGYGVSWGRCLV